MDWTAIIIVGAIVLAFVGMKRLGQASPNKVQACLQAGAKVIDVRSAAEYASGHLPGTTNIPLNELRDQIGRLAPDRGQPLLLHCQSGVRSGMGKRALRQLGYRNVHNLGSYQRAQNLLKARGGS